jgi:hypothetical protein
MLSYKWRVGFNIYDSIDKLKQHQPSQQGQAMQNTIASRRSSPVFDKGDI